MNESNQRAMIATQLWREGMRGDPLPPIAIGGYVTVQCAFRPDVSLQDVRRVVHAITYLVTRRYGNIPVRVRTVFTLPREDGDEASFQLPWGDRCHGSVWWLMRGVP